MKITGIITAAAILFSLVSYAPPEKAVCAEQPAAADAVSANPFDKQDDKEVLYDSSYWVQPKEWNTGTIDPRDYKGGIMLFFDKIGLEPDYAKGKVQRVYFSLTGATEEVSMMKFHFYYDTRLQIKKNSKGEVITTGSALSDFTTGSQMIEDGKIAFYAYGDNTLLSKGCIFTVDFIVPENAEQGEVYPFGLVYEDDGIVADTFINREKDNAGKLQMTYVFTKGIYNGYIRIHGEKRTTTTTTAATTTTTTTTVQPAIYGLGDVNNDRHIDAIDASAILTHYAMTSTNKNGIFDEKQMLAADADRDGYIDASDASLILSYYAYTSTSQETPVSFEEFVINKRIYTDN